MQHRPLQIATPDDTTLVLTRSFDAPRRLVWAAMFTPDKMRRWMLPPPGLTLSRIECDPREGGKLSLAWTDGEHDPVMTLQGVFTEVVLHERAVHTELMALASGQVIGSLIETHEFTADGDVTHMRITQRYESKEARDGALGSGMDEGMEACYVQLDSTLANPE